MPAGDVVQCRPIIPSFIDDGLLDAWVNRDDPAGPTTAARTTPGGFKALNTAGR